MAGRQFPNGRTTIVLAAILAAGGGTRLGAQTADAARFVTEAHGAQRDFESTRRSHLPWARQGTGGRCDARIGRFCYWHGETPDTAPPEPATIVRGRHALLRVLDSAARMAPADGWIAGQRVRYRLEAGAPDSAVAAISVCGAAAWWCDALLGLALHAGRHFAAAESAFDAALSEMPDSVRCAWTDLSPLLEGRWSSRYTHAGCEDRRALNARLWWLSQPFLAQPFNDRRSEHFARRTIIEIAGHSVWPETASWDDDLTELILRYGWSRWFERVEPRSQIDPSFTITGHDPQPSFAFLPDDRLLDSAYSARAGDWDLHATHAASRYAPAYATFIGPVRMLVSRFSRGDSTLIVAAYDASGDTLLATHGLRAALAVAPDERQRFVHWDSSATSSGAIAVVAPRLGALADVDLFDDAHHTSARVREAVPPLPPRGADQLSDLLLFGPSGNLPRTLGQAMPLALAQTELRRDRRLGLYWELYGNRNVGSPLDVSLTIQRIGAGWWQHARRVLHLGGGDTPIALHWQDAVRPADGVTGRAVAVDLSRLNAGTYRVRVQVTIDGSGMVVAERTLDVR
jgi:hypothetical protein